MLWILAGAAGALVVLIVADVRQRRARAAWEARARRVIEDEGIGRRILELCDEMDKAEKDAAHGDEP